MRIKRPRLTILASVGDVNPVDYSGGYVYRYGKESGSMLEWFEPDSDDDSAMVSRYACDVENPGWVDWGAVASSCGRDTSTYTGIDWLRDPVRGALAIMDAAGYYGWDNFDSYPDRLTRREAEAITRRRAKSLRRRGGAA